MTLPEGVTQRDIAAHLGIAVSTVSRALSGNPRVSEVTREAVRRAARELGQRLEPVPATLPVMIGVTHSHSARGVGAYHAETVLEQVLEGVEIACRRVDAVPYPWQQSNLIPLPESDPFFDRVSGVIMSGGEIDNEVVEGIQRRNKAIVIIGGHLPESSIPSIAADNFHGLYLATRHLLELGHRRIALINGPNTTYTSSEKKAGYLTALIESGIVPDPALLVARDDRTGLSDEAAEELTRAVLSLPDRPTALLYGTDAMARAGYRVCQELELSIPGDVSIAGFHDDDAAFAYPPMTSVQVNRFEWGIAAVDELMHILDGHRSRATRKLLPVSLVVRESTGPLHHAAAGVTER